jgi:hypothetical protein
MERNDPSNPPRRDAEGAEPLDALRRLEERLDRASDAAERLIAEATARVAGAGSGTRRTGTGSGDSTEGAGEAAGGGAEGAGQSAGAGDAGEGAAGRGSAGTKDASQRPPPAGWHSPEGPERSETELLTQVLGALRDLIPPELQRRLAEALRELLMALRALIDWYLERAERRHAEPAVVQDIPIT